MATTYGHQTGYEDVFTKIEMSRKHYTECGLGADYARLGVRIDRVMTDNGTGYKNAFRAACQELGIRHIRTRPYAPQTNGKAERFVQISLREWDLGA